MYPTLYHFFFDIFNIKITFLKAIPMFGFWVAMAFVAGSYFYTLELKRKEKEEILSSSFKKVLIGQPISPIDLVINAIIGFILGGKILYVLQDSTVFDDFPSFILSTKLNFLGGIIGAMALAGWKYYEVKQQQLPEPKEEEIKVRPFEHVSNITMISVIGGILGAKLFAYFEDPNPGPLLDFMLNLQSGLTIYGGLLLASAGSIYYMWKNKLSILVFLDAVAPGLMLAYGVGRLGCHMSGDGDWGIVNTTSKPGWMSFLPDWMWSYKYPNNVNGGISYPDNTTVPISDCIYEDKYCYELAEAVYPTPFYEFLMCLVLFGILWYFRKKIHIAGMLFALYIAFNGIERLFIEQIRINEKYHFGSIEITQAEIISSVFILVGFGWMTYLLSKSKKANS